MPRGSISTAGSPAAWKKETLAQNWSRVSRLSRIEAQDGPWARRRRHVAQAAPPRVQPISFQNPSLDSPQASLAAALLAAIGQQQAKMAASVFEGVGSTLERTWKLLQPLPRGLPPGPDGDSGFSLLSEPLSFLESVTASFGRTVTLRVAGETVILVSDPKLAKDVLATKADVFVKEGTAFFPGSSLAGNGLLVSDGEVWRRQRRLSNPAFRKSAIASYSTAMVNSAKQLVGDMWRPGQVRDGYKDFNQLTLDITIAALFGGIESTGALPGSIGATSAHTFGGSDGDSDTQALLQAVGPAISTAFTFFSKKTTTMLAIPDWVPTPDNIQYNLAVAQLDRLIYKLIADRRLVLLTAGLDVAEQSSEKRQPKGVGPTSSDLLTELLLARDEDGSDMDDVALRDELMTLLVAGQETSAILLAWTCAMLTMNPEQQATAQQELDSVLGGRTPTHKDIPSLKFLEAVIWETLRLMPPAYLVGRCTKEETTLGSWKLPKGTTALVSPYLLHRDPEFWPRALDFDPWRWMDGGDALPQAVNDSYWPFGGGPRNCIGMGFAMMEAMLVMAIILQKYSLEVSPGEPPPQPRALITLRPEGEVNILLKDRTGLP